MPQSWLPLQRTGPWRVIFCLAGALILFGTVGSNAELRISGDRNAVVLEAHDASLQEILEAFRTSFELQYNTAAGLEHKVTGTYAGSLQRVLSRLLTGNDYVIRSTANGMEIVILDSGPAPAPNNRAAQAVPPPPTEAAPPAFLAQATWNDGDGNLIAPPPANMTRFAGAGASGTWKDGDGNLIAPPAGR
jgi:hypothetical protein